MIVWPARAWSTTVSQAPRSGRRSGWRRSSTGVGTAMMTASAAARSAGSAVSASVPSSSCAGELGLLVVEQLGVAGGDGREAARGDVEPDDGVAGDAERDRGRQADVAHADDGDAEVGGGRPGVGACQLGGGGNWVHGVWDGGSGAVRVRGRRDVRRVRQGRAAAHSSLGMRGVRGASGWVTPGQLGGGPGGGRGVGVHSLAGVVPVLDPASRAFSPIGSNRSPGGPGERRDVPQPVGQVGATAGGAPRSSPSSRRAAGPRRGGGRCSWRRGVDPRAGAGDGPPPDRIAAPRPIGRTPFGAPPLVPHAGAHGTNPLRHRRGPRSRR